MDSLFLQTFNSPKCLPHWPSKSDLLEDACLPGAGSLARGAPYGPQTCHSLEGLSAVVIILSFVGCLPRDVNIDSATSLLLPSVLLLLLYIFSCRIYFLLAFRPFSSIVSLWIAVILVCPWEEVNSRSSYSMILATPPNFFFFLPFFLWNISIQFILSNFHSDSL